MLTILILIVQRFLADHPEMKGGMVAAYLAVDRRATVTRMAEILGISMKKAARCRDEVTGWPPKRYRPRRKPQPKQQIGLNLTRPICRPGNGVEHKIDQLLAEGKPVNAMRAAQLELGVSLCEAKRVIDARRDAADVEREITRFLADGKLADGKARAIMTYRKAYGVDLLTAKEAIEARMMGGVGHSHSTPLCRPGSGNGMARH
jgi:ribosomal protein L7/L12